MPTGEVPRALLDRLVALGEQGDEALRWIKENPDAHPEEMKARWETYDAIEAEYARVSALEYRYRFGVKRRT